MSGLKRRPGGGESQNRGELRKKGVLYPTGGKGNFVERPGGNVRGGIPERKKFQPTALPKTGHYKQWKGDSILVKGD